MANPIIYHANLGAYTTLDASAGTDPDYPLTNLQDYIRSSFWKGSALTDGQHLTIGFSVATQCDYAIIGNNNIANCGARVQLKGADDAGMTTNVVTVYNDFVEVEIGLISFASAYTKKYWRFTFNTYGGGPLADYPSIGNLFLGKALTFPFPYEFEPKLGDSSFQTTVGRSLSGIKRTSQAVGGVRVFDIRFRLLSDAVASDFRAFHDSVRGALRPFYFWPQFGLGTLYYVQLVKDYNPVTMMRYNQNDIQSLVMETADSEVE